MSVVELAQGAAVVAVVVASVVLVVVVVSAKPRSSTLHSYGAIGAIACACVCTY